MAERQQPGDGVRNELAGVVNGPAVLAGTVGDVHLHLSAAAAPPLVPRQLRPRPPGFTNRRAELRALDLAVTDPGASTPVIVLCGPGGIGKTALALHWLHSVADRYPDGQLCVDLGGSPEYPITPSDALAMLLRSLGVHQQVIPAAAAERRSLYRSLTAGRRIALLLEDAATAAQVRPLIPATSAGVVVVTSRARPTGLSVDHQPVFVDVDLLDEQAARDLLLTVAGSRRQAEDPTAAEAVSRLCGRLPLALSIAGARLAARPRLSLATMVAELTDERRRLQALALPGDLSVRAVFDVTYQELPDPLDLLYRRLGSHPTPEFSSGAAARAAGRPGAEVAGWLADLADRHVLDEVDDDRYRLHDLRWLHAREQAEAADSRADLRAAERRVIVWYLRAALAADQTLMPGRWRVAPTHPGDPVPVPVFPDAPAATAWLLREHANLVATVDLADRHGDDTLVWQLCQTLWSLFFRHHYHDAWIATHRTGVAAAVRCGNPLAESKLRSQLGIAHLQQAAYPDADREFAGALDAARRCGDRAAEATALESLGLSALYQGRYAEALEWLEQSRGPATGVGDPRRLALLDRHRARALGGSGRFTDAEALLHRALAELRLLGDRYNEARALTDLGEMRLRPGAPGDPAVPLREALELMRAERLPHEQASIATLLATAAERAGDLAAARAYLRDALTWYADLRAPQAATVSDRLAALDRLDRLPPGLRPDQGAARRLNPCQDPPPSPPAAPAG